MWVRLWILSSSQVKGNCHQVTVSFHLIKPYFSFNDVNQDLHYNGSVETLKKISGRDDSVQSPGSHIIQKNLWQIPRLFSNSLCIKWDIFSSPYKSNMFIELTHDRGTELEVSDLTEIELSF